MSERKGKVRRQVSGTTRNVYTDHTLVFWNSKYTWTVAVSTIHSAYFRHAGCCKISVERPSLQTTSD